MGLKYITYFLVAQQLNTYFCVFVCCESVLSFLSLNIYNFLEYSKRESDLLSKAENRQTTNTQILEIKDMSFTFQGRSSTGKDNRKLGHMLIIPAQTGNGTMKMYTTCEIISSVDS